MDASKQVSANHDPVTQLDVDLDGHGVDGINNNDETCLPLGGEASTAPIRPSVTTRGSIRHDDPDGGDIEKEGQVRTFEAK